MILKRLDTNHKAIIINYYYIDDSIMSNDITRKNSSKNMIIKELRDYMQ